MLVFALMAIALLAVLPSVKQQMQRDREDELRHRGTMYMRAIQRYYKKNGRYPNGFEELENSNHIRFLRKRYKDPMSWDPQTHKEKDFKLLHMQDVAMGGGIGPGAGLLNPGGGVLPPTGPSAPTGGSTPPTGPLGPGGALQQGLNALQGLGLSQSFGGCQGPSGTQNLNGSQPLNGGQGPGGLQTQNGNNNETPDASNPGNPSSDSPGPSSPGSPGIGKSNPSSPGGAPGLGGQVFGGGGIVGVVSTNKKVKSIHEYNKKSHYSDWCFIYDPSMDAYGLLFGPFQPITISSGGIGQPIAGTPGTGQPSAFGQPGPSNFNQPSNPTSPQNSPPPNPGGIPPDNQP
jgi:hypothetical protein